MKTNYYLLIIATIFNYQISIAKTITVPTVQEQLESLNKYWKNTTLNYSVLKERILFTNDVSLIQMHLGLVETELRNKDVSFLTNEQKQNRIKCLDILHSYSLNGVFPKNLYHSERTPYFIDKFGTVCAVGQLIISTGYSEFANKVMIENNNGYISELNVKYPEVSEWAKTYGFTIDELAWIQPCYCSTNNPGTLNVSCNGGNDGYFVPIVTGWPSPYVYAWYRWNGSTWSSLSCGGCDLTAGNYKCTVTDINGAEHDYFATITEPPAITQVVNFTDDNGSCNGSAGVVVNGGTPGYTYSWTPGGYTTPSINNLCPNTYSLTITDSKGCISTETVSISFATKLNESSKSGYSIFPNPVSTDIHFVLDNFFIPNKTFSSIYNLFGQKIISGKLNSSEGIINVDKLEKGIYYIVIENGMLTERKQFIKN
jgi:hypothetical protein